MAAAACYRGQRSFRLGCWSRSEMTPSPLTLLSSSHVFPLLTASCPCSTSIRTFCYSHRGPAGSDTSVQLYLHVVVIIIIIIRVLKYVSWLYGEILTDEFSVSITEIKSRICNFPRSFFLLAPSEAETKQTKPKKSKIKQNHASLASSCSITSSVISWLVPEERHRLIIFFQRSLIDFFVKSVHSGHIWNSTL